MSGAGQAFQWYRGHPGDLTQPVASATTPSLTVVAADPPSTYWVLITNASGSLGSRGATVAARVTGTPEGWQDFTVNLPGVPSSADQASLLHFGNELYVLGQTGVYRSTNRGDTFSAISGVSGTSAYDLSISPLRFVKNANSFIYVGDARNAASNTENYTPLHRLSAGQTVWTQASQVNLPDTVFTDSVDDVAYDAATGSYYEASNFAGCYYSADGLAWEERRVGLPTQGTGGSGQFANATSVLVRNGKVFLTVQHPSDGGVFTSTDQGLTWPRKTAPLTGLTRLFEQDGRVMVAASGPTTVTDGTYVSDDNGETWERRPFLGILSQIRGNGSLLVTTPAVFGNQDLRFSTTRGDTWDEIDRFTTENYTERYFLNGTLDVSFANTTVFAERPDGTIIAWGAASGGSIFSQNGNLVSNFTVPTVGTAVVTSMLALADGSTLMGGLFRLPGASSSRAILRVLADGTVDASFPPVVTTTNVTQLKWQSSGKIIYVVGSQGIGRIGIDGVADSTFAAAGLPFSSSITDIEIQPDDNIVVCGSGGTVRLSENGAADATFVPLTDFTGTFTAARSLANGRLHAIGALTRRVPSATVTTAILTTTVSQPGVAVAITNFYTSAGIPPDQQTDDGDFDKDGVPNLLEYLYGSDPGSATSGVSFVGSEQPLTGAAINSIAAAGLDPAQTYYVVEIRLPKNTKGLTLATAATVNFPNFTDGSGSMNAYGPIIDDGDFTIQRHYTLPSIQAAAKAFWRLEATR
ncbi:hypothetical protein HZ994_03610 [Akkermansiaceae bacterium]|nr:hypothetical protein HZ994_03610 [Akkermansiaceae bacterium]